MTAQIVDREYYLPQFAHELSIKAKPGDGPLTQPILAQYDKLNRILIDGNELIASEGQINSISLRLDGDLPGFGDAVVGESAHWQPANGSRPSGYLISHVSRPVAIDTIPAVRFDKRLVFITRRDAPNLQSGQCFYATSVHCDLLQSNESARKLASLPSLINRVANPAVHSSAALKVLLHSRLVRPPLDVALICLVLPLAVNLKGRNLFLMAAVALGTVVLFFAVKMIASAMGGGGYLISPVTAGWLPLLILGPIAYYRYRLVQVV